MKNRGMRATIVGLLLLSGTFLIGSWQEVLGINLGEKLPPLVIKGVGGGNSRGFHSDQIMGKVTMINFWATWCEACKVELLEMEKGFKVFKSERDLNLVFINLDKDPRQAVDWAHKNLSDPQGFLKKNLIDPQFKVAEKLEVDSFPMTFVINRMGKVSYIQKGYQAGQGQTEKLITHLRSGLQASPGTH